MSLQLDFMKNNNEREVYRLNIVTGLETNN